MEGASNRRSFCCVYKFFVLNAMYRTHRIISVSTIALFTLILCVVASPRAHAATLEERIDALSADLDLIEGAVREMLPQGEVLGASTTLNKSGSGRVASLIKNLTNLQKKHEREQSAEKKADLEEKISKVMATIAAAEGKKGTNATGNRTVDLKVNGSDGPVYLKSSDKKATVEWSSKGMKSCSLRLMSARRQGVVFTALPSLAPKGKWTVALPPSFADHPAILRIVCRNGETVRGTDSVPLNQDWTKNWKDQEESGDVLGAATTATTDDLKKQLETALAQKEEMVKKLAELKGSGTGTSTLRQIEFIETQRLPFYEARIKQLTVRIHKAESGTATTTPSTADKKFNARTFKIHMNGVAKLGVSSSAALIKWVDAAKADSAALVITKYGDGTEVLNTSVTPSEKKYEWEDPEPGMYRVTLTGTKGESTVESEGMIRVVDTRKGNDELIVKASIEDPDTMTIAVDASSASDWTTVMAFELDTDDSTNAIEVTKLPVKLTVGMGTVGKLVSKVQLVINGETYTAAPIGRDAKSRFFSADTTGLTIAAGESVTVEVMVEFRPLAPKLEGATVTASMQAKGIKAESTSVLLPKQITGSAIGETHSLRTLGVVLGAGDMSIDKQVNDDATTDDDEGVFTLEFDVTAFESDVYISTSAAAGKMLGTAGVNFQVLTSSGAAAVPSSLSGTLSSTADTDGGRYVVNEGETETFTLTVTVDPKTTGFYSVALHSVNYATTNANPTTKQLALPQEDFVTDPLSI